MAQYYESFWMQQAIKAGREGDTPFGAVIVNAENDYISAFNSTNEDGATAHAEMNVIRKISTLPFKHPSELTLYTTVEPCPMCMSAIIWAGIGNIRYGISIEEVSVFIKQIKISSHEVASKSWKQVTIKGGIEKEKCLELWGSTP